MLSSLLRRRNSSLLRSTTMMTTSQASSSSSSVWWQTRSFSVTGDDDELYAEETIAETGEWAGCKRSFMAPLLIRTRGSETLYNRESRVKSSARSVACLLPFACLLFVLHGRYLLILTLCFQQHSSTRAPLSKKANAIDCVSVDSYRPES